jgi:hypothetical protein
MPRALYRLFQSRYAKLRSLRQFMWNRQAGQARRRNTYLIEQMENRYLLSADVAPFALAEELLNDVLVVEQLIETGLAQNDAAPDLQLVRQHENTAGSGPQDVNAGQIVEGAETQVADRAADLSSGEIQFVQQLSGHQFVVIDRSVEDYQALLTTFMGEDAQHLVWETQETSAGSVLIAQWKAETSTLFGQQNTDDQQADLPERQYAEQVTLVLLDAQSDGVQQLTEILSQYQDVSALHVLSHGTEGAVDLGTASINSATLERYHSQLQAWGAALKADGDILLYGCDVAAGEVGISFVDRLAGVTQADIAASMNLTGNAFYGGDWYLEFDSGLISSKLLFASNDPIFENVLATLPDKVVVVPNAGASTGVLTLSASDWGSTIKPKVGTAVGADASAKDVVIDLKNDAFNNASIVIRELQGKIRVEVTAFGGGQTLVIQFESGTELKSLRLDDSANIEVKARLVELDISDATKAASPSNVAVAFGTSTGIFSLGTKPTKAIENVASSGDGTVNNSGVKLSLLSGENFAVTLNGGSVGKLKAMGTLGDSDDHLALIFAKGGLIGEVEFLDTTIPLDVYFLDGVEGKVTETTGTNKYKINAVGDKEGVQQAVVINHLASFTSGAGSSIVHVNEIDGKSTVITTGKGNDIIRGDVSDDTMIGGAGNDTYQFEAGWGADRVIETNNGGSSDSLDFAAITTPLTVDFYHSATLTALSPSVPNPVQFGMTVAAGTETISATFIENLVVNDANIINNYRVHDHWAYQKPAGLLGETGTITIGNRLMDNETSTLDLSAVSHDLTIELWGNGHVVVTAEVASTKYTYILDAYGIKDIKVGKGENTIFIMSAEALKGELIGNAAVTSKTILDYSKFNIGAMSVPDNAAAIGFNTEIVGSDETGLLSTGTFTAKVTIDGSQVSNISIAGSAAQTMTQLVQQLNTDTTGGTWKIKNGLLVLTSATSGEEASVEITDTNLFDSLVGSKGVLEVQELNISAIQGDKLNYATGLDYTNTLTKESMSYDLSAMAVGDMLKFSDVGR